MKCIWMLYLIIWDEKASCWEVLYRNLCGTWRFMLTLRNVKLSPSFVFAIKLKVFFIHGPLELFFDYFASEIWIIILELVSYIAKYSNTAALNFILKNENWPLALRRERLSAEYFWRVPSNFHFKRHRRTHLASSLFGGDFWGAVWQEGRLQPGERCTPGEFTCKISRLFGCNKQKPIVRTCCLLTLFFISSTGLIEIL